MVGKPSDVESEVRAAFDTIQKWNYINAFSHKLMLLPSHWSLDAYPTLSDGDGENIPQSFAVPADLAICGDVKAVVLKCP